MSALATRPRVDVEWLVARELAHASATCLPARDVPLARASGATLARPLRAQDAMPAFDTAAMDGYALGSPGRCRLLAGLVAAGDPPWTEPLAAGEAVRIATGAATPPGTFCVLRQEDAVLTVEGVCGPTLRAGRHIRRRGEDAAAGTEVAPAGTAVSPALLGLAAGSGHRELPVVPRPVVSTIISGDEVAGAPSPRAPTQRLGPGQLHDAIGPMLPTLLAGLGATPAGVRHVPDHPVGRLADAVAAERAAGATVIVVSGATSTGPADGLRGLLAASDAELIVGSARCRPAHPQLLARWAAGDGAGPCWLVGLPGNPFAALVAAHTLLAPLLAGLAGRPLPRLPQLVPHPALVDVIPGARGRMTQLVPITWDGAPVGSATLSRPASLRAAAQADALAAIPPDWTPGRPVPVVPLAG